ncbi:MAG: hypothetical protein ACOY3P_05795 [Planctomycetota bacterium]
MAYRDRPEVCRRFRCAWLADPDWPEAWRPDLSGVMCLRESLADGLPVGAIYEIRRGALQTETAAEILEALLATTVVVVVIDTDQQRRTLFGDRATPDQRRSEYHVPQSRAA